MSNNNTTVKQLYVCDGLNKDFAIPFFFLTGEETVIKVYLVDDATEVATLLTLTTHYTLNSPATIVTTVATYAAGKSILVKRISPRTQLSEFAQGPFPFEAVEEQFDRVVSITQELEDNQSSFIGLDIGSTLSNVKLPPASSNKLIGWNLLGTGLENKDALSVTALQAEIDAVEVRASALEAQDIVTIAKDVAQDAAIASLAVRVTQAESDILLYTVDYTQLTGSQVIYNNQVAPELITQLNFDGDGTQLANIEVQIHRRTSTDNRFARVKLVMLFDIENLTWYIGREATTLFAGEVDGIVFSVVTDINKVGRVYYTSDNMAGLAYSGYLKFLGKEIPTGV